MAISRRALITGTGAVAAAAAFTPAIGHAAPSSARPAGPTAALPVASRNSIYTRGGAGPLYWNIYGWSFPHNAPIPEDEWQANIDWLATDFAPHGYTMACTDGWIEPSTKTTNDGYIVSYNDDWQHDWAYWIAYLKSKGMTLGVYYNPLWVHAAAVADSSKTVAGTDIPLADIVNDGDFMGSGIGGKTLYWADVTKPGAKEFIQGYVRYFKELGVPYLRVDFLAWYETGYDANIGSVGTAHGRENYLTALGWMNEAAGDDMELSLVMPELIEHGAGELANGDLIRINADADKGGWDRLSGGRQTWQEHWSQWFNPFLGFTGFADRSGRGQLILDGDFLMMNTFANDDERRTCISLMTMAGSPLTISDLHSNIADHGWAFTNPEVLALHRAGLVGKPYFHSATPYSEDMGSRDSERWAGQLPDGSWAVALFNRSDTAATRELDFGSALGIEGAVRVRDLWRKTDLPAARSLRADLPAHGCQLVRLTPRGRMKRYHAAFAAWGGGAGFANSIDGHSGMGYASIDADGASVTFAVAVDQAGSYPISLRYAAASDAALTLGAEEVDRSPVGPARQVSFPSTGGQWATRTGEIRLAKGTNLVTLIRTDGDHGAVELNHIELG